MKKKLRVWCVLRRNIYTELAFGQLSERNYKRIMETHGPDFDGWLEIGREFDLDSLTGRCRLRIANGVERHELEYLASPETLSRTIKVPKVVTKMLLGIFPYTTKEYIDETIDGEPATYRWIDSNRLAIKHETIYETKC